MPTPPHSVCVMMADNEEESPRPFRRERNLSNRNFKKRNSNRRFSTESHSSIDGRTIIKDQQTTTPTSDTATSIDSTSTSAAQSPAPAMNPEAADLFKQRPQLRVRLPSMEVIGARTSIEPLTPDPCFLDVKQKVLRFEKVCKNGGGSGRPLPPPRGVRRTSPPTQETFPPSPLSEDTPQSPVDSPTTTTSTSGSFTVHQRIVERQSEDEVDNDSDCEEEYHLPEVAQEASEHMPITPEPTIVDGDGDGDGLSPDNNDITSDVQEFGIDDFGKVEYKRQMSSVANIKERKNAIKDFPRNYRSTPRPKTEIIEIKNHQVVKKYHSYYHEKNDDGVKDEPIHHGHGCDDDEEIEMRDKVTGSVQPILNELIATEESYVENLLIGIENYGNIFQRKDLPIGLRGKKYVLLGNVEQIVEFHRDVFLPMLKRNRRDLKMLFEDFQKCIDADCFYGYVIYTMNKQRSLKLCDVYKNYFKMIQLELEDKLGINSFLVQPIQRMARYPLLLQQFITTLFKNREYVMKPLIESCCRLEKRMRTLLTTTNESEEINDIVECHEFNVFYQGKFRKVNEFHAFDRTLRRSYRSKVFIFDKCIIYTEIKGKSLLFHGRYPCEHIGISAGTKSFTLFYERRNQQEVEFKGDPTLVEAWLELIRDMISSFVTQEKIKLKERYSRESDHQHRKTPSLSLYRDSNRFSSDSGIGNIWVMPKPEKDEELNTKRTTWYAEGM